MSVIRDTILSLKFPVVFHGKIAEWDMLKWGEKEWCTQFGDDLIPFRCGLNKCTTEPLWERTCTTEYMSMSKFFDSANEASQDSWKYFDYKYLKHWLQGSEAFTSLSWANLGFPELTKDDCTLWIGSSGAHTPCHMDTYGCNLVAQIYGHKQWILFPPSESSKLKLTRVPYEESSVYSALNFNAPIEDICSSLDNIYTVILSPGDVLFVPRHWWHYVENLDTAIAINTWLPLPEDHISRLDESLVRFFISQASSNLPPTQLLEILNPNEDDLCSVDLSTTMNQMEICLQNVLEASNFSNISVEESVSETIKCGRDSDLSDVVDDASDTENKDCKKRKLSSDSFPAVSKSARSDVDFEFLKKCDVSDLKVILDAKCKCGSQDQHRLKLKSNAKLDNSTNMLSAVINSFCHPEVLKTVKKLLLEQSNSRQ